nr:outer membrane beta-barrel protein [Polyangiaceae bacterium]
TTKIKVDDPAVSLEEESSQTSFFFLGSNPQGNVSNPLGSPFIAPRIGFDYFVVNNVSVGGSVTYISDSSSGDRTQGNQQQDLPDQKTNTFLVAPRAGYALMFSDTFGLWPRGGITYVSSKAEVDDNETSGSMLALSVEGNLVITPVPHAGFLIGPTLDFPILGSGEQKAGQNTTDLDTFKVTTFGLQAGIFIWL